MDLYIVHSRLATSCHILLYPKMSRTRSWEMQSMQSNAMAWNENDVGYTCACVLDISGMIISQHWPAAETRILRLTINPQRIRFLGKRVCVYYIYIYTICNYREGLTNFLWKKSIGEETPAHLPRPGAAQWPQPPSTWALRKFWTFFRLSTHVLLLSSFTANLSHGTLLSTRSIS